jgi:hypothetical protein
MTANPLVEVRGIHCNLKGPHGSFDIKKFQKSKLCQEMTKFDNLFEFWLNKLNLKFTYLKPLFRSGGFGKLKLNFYFNKGNARIEVLNNWFYVLPIFKHMFVFDVKPIIPQSDDSLFHSILSSTMTQIFSSNDAALLEQISFQIARCCSCQLQKIVFIATSLKTLIFPLVFLKHTDISSTSCNLVSLNMYPHEDVDKLYQNAFLNCSSDHSLKSPLSLLQSDTSSAFYPPSKDSFHIDQTEKIFPFIPL